MHRMERQSNNITIVCWLWGLASTKDIQWYTQSSDGKHSLSPKWAWSPPPCSLCGCMFQIPKMLINPNVPYIYKPKPHLNLHKRSQQGCKYKRRRPKVWMMYNLNQDRIWSWTICRAQHLFADVWSYFLAWILSTVIVLYCICWTCRTVWLYSSRHKTWMSFWRGRVKPARY